MEVIRGMSFLERNKAVGPDGLSPFVFKDGGGMLISELKLLGTMWTGADIPIDLCELVTIPIYGDDRSLYENQCSKQMYL